MQTQAQNNPAAGIGFIVGAMAAISINDMLVKQLSGGYPLHEIVLIRSAIGIMFSLIFVQLEGGWHILKTRTPGLHALRGIVIVISNLTFFTALAVIPLADATALFFVAPLMITLMSIPILGEKVGPLRLGAVIVGFLGVLLMMQPWAGEAPGGVSRWVLALPVIAAACYALNQVLTRKLGVASKASAMAVYIQGMFIIVSLLVWLVAGDGRFADVTENESLRFLLRPWVIPEGIDRWLLLGLGMNSAVIGYAISQAYRMANAATVAPFEYVGLPMAILWGWLIWNELPGLWVWVGTVLIVGAGLFVFFRERAKARPMIRRRVHRRY
ncbi:DMT family transporter [Alisedimentitalea sp. MJ-SS2]|uniref:DMT family transporter n=1 Tax=Aliisedimentitalea sp. MJ-SS2 TaxID=3049795 RepID=UPI00290C5014|nr:DMT family transporter [Alisedimentitalea sp. MJ-SS2]MDU8928467.1 DMT family transporter [Alisedimentitalea sp. MJ-SS2]